MRYEGELINKHKCFEKLLKEIGRFNFFLSFRKFYNKRKYEILFFIF